MWGVCHFRNSVGHFVGNKLLPLLNLVGELLPGVFPRLLCDEIPTAVPIPTPVKNAVIFTVPSALTLAPTRKRRQVKIV
jgi:hypothetical protein